MTERTTPLEDENPNPTETEDDGLGETVPAPVDPKEVGEDEPGT